MRRLEGKIAVVTGGSSGIGFATARAFTEEGATVYATGRNEEKLAKAAATIGTTCIPVVVDSTRLADLRALYTRVQAECGRVDVLFANAGIAEFRTLGQIDEDHFDKIFNTNVKGAVFTVQEALPMIPDGGTIILTSSVVGSKGLASNSIYAATKAALRSFARTWTTDLKDRKIRVNVVSPGPVETEGLSELLGEGEFAQRRRESFTAAVPLGRIGKPEEIARAVVFLASAEASYITGTELFVDGGFAQV